MQVFYNSFYFILQTIPKLIAAQAHHHKNKKEKKKKRKGNTFKLISFSNGQWVYHQSSILACLCCLEQEMILENLLLHEDS